MAMKFRRWLQLGGKTVVSCDNLSLLVSLSFHHLSCIHTHTKKTALRNFRQNMVFDYYVILCDFFYDSVDQDQTTQNRQSDFDSPQSDRGIFLSKKICKKIFGSLKLTSKFVLPLQHLPHKPDLLAALKKTAFENIVRKGEMPVTSIFSFARNVFHTSMNIFHTLYKIYIVVCKWFQFGHVYFYIWQGLMNSHF